MTFLIVVNLKKVVMEVYVVPIMIILSIHKQEVSLIAIAFGIKDSDVVKQLDLLFHFNRTKYSKTLCMSCYPKKKKQSKAMQWTSTLVTYCQSIDFLLTYYSDE